MKVRESKDGLVIDVQVQPGAKKSRVIGIHGDALKIAIAAPPVDGKANGELIAFMAKALGIRRSQIEIVRGETSRQKTVCVRGRSAEEIRTLVNAAPSKE